MGKRGTLWDTVGSYRSHTEQSLVARNANDMRSRVTIECYPAYMEISLNGRRTDAKVWTSCDGLS